MPGYNGMHKGITVLVPGCEGISAGNGGYKNRGM